MRHRANRRLAGRAPAGVTLPELMVAIGVIILILAILLPALSAVRAQSQMSSSMNNMRQIATWMNVYARDNRETVLPSQFDYRDDVFTYKGNVRKEPTGSGGGAPPQEGDWHQGTWTDILWTINELGSFAEVEPTFGHDYRYDSPDKALYDAVPSYDANPLRAASHNRRDFDPGAVGAQAKPFGSGANEVGYPGFFAANDFFNASPDAPDYDLNGDEVIDAEEATPEIGRWWTLGQIRAPERSLYLIDSLAGEVIAAGPHPHDAYENDPSAPGGRTIEVDFRYSDSALMLMLDGSIDLQSAWEDLEELEERGIRVRGLDKRALPSHGAWE